MSVVSTNPHSFIQARVSSFVQHYRNGAFSLCQMPLRDCLSPFWVAPDSKMVTSVKCLSSRTIRILVDRLPCVIFY